MSFAHPDQLERSIDALRKDLIREGGPQISTVRNYNFAILPYPPEKELLLRRKVQSLCGELRNAGWNTPEIALSALLLARLRAEGQEFLDVLIAREKRAATSADPWRGLNGLKERVVSIIEGPDGLAKDVIRAVHEKLTQHPDKADRTVVFLGRAGALYPFFRTSALLKHVAGHTNNVPVVLLYPGTVVGDAGLSFMGVLPPDRDYRPRIYR